MLLPVILGCDEFEPKADECIFVEYLKNMLDTLPQTKPKAKLVARTVTFLEKEFLAKGVSG